MRCAWKTVSWQANAPLLLGIVPVSDDGNDSDGIFRRFPCLRTQEKIAARTRRPISIITEVIFTTIRIFCYLFANGSTKKCREFSSVNYITDEISNEESQTDTLAIEQSINAYRFGSHTESAASDAENPGRTPNRDKFPRSLTKLPANLFAGIEIFLNIAYRSCIRRTPTGPYLFSKY